MSTDFSHATIKSTRTEYSFNNLESGLQTFRGAEILYVDRSSAKQIAFSLPCWKPDRAVAHSGTLSSFNNSGTGSQTFDGLKFNWYEVFVCVCFHMSLLSILLFFFFLFFGGGIYYLDPWALVGCVSSFHIHLGCIFIACHTYTALRWLIFTQKNQSINKIE